MSVFDNAPPVSDALINHLKQHMGTDVLLSEQPEIQGLERLGFVKGARFVLSTLETINKRNLEGEEE